MIVVTTNTIEGGKIKRYIDTVCANTVIGTNVFSDFTASFIDFLEAVQEHIKGNLNPFT